MVSGASDRACCDPSTQTIPTGARGIARPTAGVAADPSRANSAASNQVAYRGFTYREYDTLSRGEDGRPR